MTKNLADMEIPVRLYNYKIFKGEKEFLLKNSYVYFVSGPNNTGKTSFKDIFAILQSGKNDISKPVTTGEEEGFIECTIPGADGRPYLIRHDFSNDKHNKFVAIDEDGKKVSSIGDFRKLFNYTHFTAEEFFIWTKTADGRKKQCDIILNLLASDTLAEYEILCQNELVIYDARTKKGYEKDQLVELCKSGRLTEEEETFVSGLQEHKNLLSTVQGQINGASTTEVTRSSLIEKKATTEKHIADKVIEISDLVNDYTTDVKDLNETIASLQLQLDTANAKREKIIKDIPGIKKAKEESLANMRGTLIGVDEELSKLPSVNVTELNIQKTELETKIEKINTLKTKSSNESDNIAKRDKALKDYEQLSRDIVLIRDGKQKLIEDSNLGVSNVSIEDDHVKIDGYEFKENQVSKSQAILLIANLMCSINESPIQVIGSANDLDWEILDQLYALAKEKGKIMILDQVDRDATDVAIIGYEPKNLAQEPGTPSNARLT